MEKKQKKKLILVISISSLVLIAGATVWHFWGRTYEGRNEIERFKNYIEINYQTAKGRREAIEKAANNGNAVAQYYLGVCYTQGGLGFSKDYKKAIEWWKKAAKNGNTHAQWKLADCYRRGSYGLGKDKKEANKWNKKAAEECRKSAEAGDVKAQFQLANLYARGKGIKRDYKKAFKWYAKAAENGDVNAQFRLGLSYDRGLYKTTKSRSQAEKWYKKAAEQDNIWAIIYLGALYAKHEDYDKAVQQWEKAVKKKNIVGEYCLMRCYELGLGVPKDINKAKQYLKQISGRMGAQRTLVFLGRAYYYGQYGLPGDKAKGKELIRKAAKNGSKRAARMLKRMK